MSEKTHIRFSGKLLYEARKRAGLSRFRLSQLLDFEIKQSTVRQYEIGVTTPKINTYLRMVEVLGVKHSELLENAES